MLPVGNMEMVIFYTTSIPMGAMHLYTQESSVHSFIHDFYFHGCDVFTCKNVLHTRSYIFYSHWCNVRTWNPFLASVAKPVLWQLILLPCTLAYTFSIPIGAMYIYTCKNVFILTDMILYPLPAPIFTMITEVWPHANWAVVTTNLTVIINVGLIEGFL